MNFPFTFFKKINDITTQYLTVKMAKKTDTITVIYYDLNQELNQFTLYLPRYFTATYIRYIKYQPLNDNDLIQFLFRVLQLTPTFKGIYEIKGETITISCTSIGNIIYYDSEHIEVLNKGTFYKLDKSLLVTYLCYKITENNMTFDDIKSHLTER